VLIVDEGNSARQVLGLPTAPIRSVVVGIVDEIAMDDARVLPSQGTDGT
jgi:microcompartment protein CcmK/EutM